MKRVYLGIFVILFFQLGCSSSIFNNQDDDQSETDVDAGEEEAVLEENASTDEQGSDEIVVTDEEAEEETEEVVPPDSVVALGKILFNDKNLSANSSQSCATCHDPNRAFIDSREDSEGRIAATSLGDDGVTFGDRNSPTINYAAFIPAFSQRNNNNGFVGGLFWDGRSDSLASQAGDPILNPVEMGMPDKASVVARILEDPIYVNAFQEFYGANIFDDVDTAYDALAQSIGAYEESDEFMTFDSKYDKSLIGEFVYDPSTKTGQGRDLFFSGQTNCTRCHQLNNNNSTQEVFTDFRYHNLGLPTNTAARTLNGQDLNFVDNGVFDNPTVTDQAQTGRFRVPTLRNVSVTGPYMHNGVFQSLKTVISFYDSYHNNTIHTVNPETGAAWASPEVNANISLNILRDGDALSDAEVEALVCFLHTLTDARYEDLIVDDGIDCDAP